LSAKALVARPLEGADFGAWDALASQRGCLFDSLRWTGLFGSALSRIGIYDAGGDLRGGFCVWEQRKLGLRVLRNPPYTPQIGPFFEPRASNPAARTGEQRAVVEAMAEYLSTSGAAVVSLGLSFGITDCLPFRWRGWKVVPHYTYRIDLSQDEDAMLAGTSSQRRKSIRRAIESGLRVEETSDMSALRSLVTESYARQRKAFSWIQMDTVLAGYQPGRHSQCHQSIQEGEAAAAVYVVNDSRTAYYLMGGYSESAHHGAGPLAMWHGILKAKEIGLEVFDFEGSVIPSVERYLRGFGGTLTPLFTVQRAWLPLEMGLKLVRRELF
jgi:hypothetical protein